MSFFRKRVRAARRMAILPLLMLAFPAASAGPSAATASGKAPQWEKDVNDWRTERAKRLRNPDGWLTVVGLDWLEAGDNSVGAAASSRIRLPAGHAPDKVGVIEKKGLALRFRAEPGAGVKVAGKVVDAIDLATDKSGEPTTLTVGSVSFFPIERGGRVGIRIKDREAAALKDFKGVESYPASEKWVMEARWEPYSPPKKVKTSTVIGTIEEQDSPGAAVFEINGKSCRIEPVLEEPDATELFFVFGDKTNGGMTYGGGRFLYAPLPKNGKIVLDFNRAYNPPCVFTSFATCPIPRREDRLPVFIEAGEKVYHGESHRTKP